MPGEKARVDGSITFFDSSGHVVLRDFEIYSSDTNRASSQAGVGFNVTDIQIIPGLASFAPNMSFINLVVHDHTRHGIYISRIASNNLVYGCVIYNNGWISPDNAEGHGLHVQSMDGVTEISDNLVLNNSGASMHIYDNGAGAWLAGVTLDGNVAFNAGAIQNKRAYQDWVVGVEACPGRGRAKSLASALPRTLELALIWSAAIRDPDQPTRSSPVKAKKVRSRSRLTAPTTMPAILPSSSKYGALTMTSVLCGGDGVIMTSEIVALPARIVSWKYRRSAIPFFLSDAR